MADGTWSIFKGGDLERLVGYEIDSVYKAFKSKEVINLGDIISKNWLIDFWRLLYWTNHNIITVSRDNCTYDKRY